MSQGLVFYGELVSFLLLPFVAATFLYFLAAPLVRRQFKKFFWISLVITIWVIVFYIRSTIVPGGEVHSSQYSGDAALAQMAFFLTTIAAIVLCTVIFRRLKNRSGVRDK